MNEERTPSLKVDDARFGGAPDTPQNADDSRTMALAAWVLLLAGVVTFLPGIIAAIIAYAKRGNAPEPWRGHFDAVIRMFWIWFWLTVIATVLIWTIIGVLIPPS